MPLYMDVHRSVNGASAQDVAGAHQKDLETQAKHGVRYLKYWHDPRAGKIFCLCEAPSAEAAHAVHREAHGLVAEEIYQVEEHA
jgi:hypothetical protein